MKVIVTALKALDLSGTGESACSALESTEGIVVGTKCTSVFAEAWGIKVIAAAMREGADAPPLEEEMRWRTLLFAEVCGMKAIVAPMKALDLSGTGESACSAQESPEGIVVGTKCTSVFAEVCGMKMIVAAM